MIHSLMGSKLILLAGLGKSMKYYLKRRYLTAAIWLVLLFPLSSIALATSPPPVQSQNGMVVTAQHLATDVGLRVLLDGGNAIDAAVAVGYALAVVHPCCGNIGGGGFMLIHRADGKDVFINFREKAPLAATPTMFLDADKNIITSASTDSPLAVAVPGTVAGLDMALRKYGTMGRMRVMTPAIKLAESGFVLGQDDVALLRESEKQLRRDKNSALVFLRNGHSYEIGDKLIQKQLSNTLKMIARQGATAFYRGRIADSLVKDSQKNGGILTKVDLANYTAQELEPVRCDYRGYYVISAPPPSSGGTTLCEILNILEGYPMGSFGFQSAKGIHYMVEAMRHAYRDRNESLGDPDFVSNPVEKLLSKKYADSIRRGIPNDQAVPSEMLGSSVVFREGENTTHYSVMDKYGNAVSVTYTINRYFGSYHIADNTGFLLNNEMDDFTAKPGIGNRFDLIQGEANAIAPGKRPLSSMSPTIVIRNGNVFMITGSPGGSKIISSTLQSIINVIDYGLNIREAVDAPRLHHQWLPDTIFVEKYAVSPDSEESLKRMGYRFVVQRPWGTVDAILVDGTTGTLYGANDDRRPGGSARGY